MLGLSNSKRVALAAGCLLAFPVAAQDVEFDQTPLGALIAQDESGGRNIPNFRFDDTHTAGGHFQITDTNWRHYGPLLGIDIDRYPNAMSATEQLQGQVAGKMWAEQGVMPWAPYNRQLREHLDHQPQIIKVRRVNQTPAGPAPEVRATATAASESHNWNVFASGASEGGQSFLITGEGR